MGCLAESRPLDAMAEREREGERRKCLQMIDMCELKVGSTLGKMWQVASPRSFLGCHPPQDARRHNRQDAAAPDRWPPAGLAATHQPTTVQWSGVSFSAALCPVSSLCQGLALIDQSKLLFSPGGVSEDTSLVFPTPIESFAVPMSRGQRISSRLG